MGPDEKDTGLMTVCMDGQPVQYAGEITLPEQVERPAPPLLSSMGLTMEQAGKVAEAMAEGFRAICIAMEEAAAAVTKIWGAIQAEEFRRARRWAEAVNRPLAARYHRTKKKRIRKKYAKRILEWYRTEVAPC